MGFVSRHNFVLKLLLHRVISLAAVLVQLFLVLRRKIYDILLKFDDELQEEARVPFLVDDLLCLFNTC